MKKPTTRGLKATLSILMALAMIAAAGAPAQATTSDNEKEDAVGFLVPILIDGNGMIHALGGGTDSRCGGNSIAVNCVTLEVQAQAMDASEACEEHNGETATGCTVTAAAEAEAWNWLPAGELTLEETNHAGQLDACTWPVQETGCKTTDASQNQVETDIGELEKGEQTCENTFKFEAIGMEIDSNGEEGIQVPASFEVCYTYTGQSVQDNVPPPGSLEDWIGQQLEPLDPLIDTAGDVASLAVDVAFLVATLIVLAPFLVVGALCYAAETIMDTMDPESRSLDLVDDPLLVC